MLKVLVPKERASGETRVAATPETVMRAVLEHVAGRVPVIAHSDHTTSPWAHERSTVAVRSGITAKICSQFRRTWSRPVNPWAGCAGVSLR